MEEYLKKINSSDSHGEQSINWVTHQKCHDMFILSKVRTYIYTQIHTNIRVIIQSIHNYLIKMEFYHTTLKSNFGIQKYTNVNLF